MDDGAAATRAGGGVPLLVVLDRVADPGNAGTIIRSADAMGAGGVVLTAGSVDPHNGKCVRSTAGSIFHLPIATGAEPDEVIAACRAAGIGIVLADAHARDALDDRARVPDGRIGSDPAQASPEKGQHIIDASIPALIQDVSAFAAEVLP